MRVSYGVEVCWDLRRRDRVFVEVAGEVFHVAVQERRVELGAWESACQIGQVIRSCQRRSKRRRRGKKEEIRVPRGAFRKLLEVPDWRRERSEKERRWREAGSCQGKERGKGTERRRGLQRKNRRRKNSARIRQDSRAGKQEIGVKIGNEETLEKRQIRGALLCTLFLPLALRVARPLNL